MPVFLILLLQGVTTAPATTPDPDSLREVARRAEAEYESLSRRLAPLTLGMGGGPCDEIVGRFCLRFDNGPQRPYPPEPPRVARARQEAIRALRIAFAAAPGDWRVAGPLLRYLLEDRKAREAVSAARAFAESSSDSLRSALFLGLALHVAGEIPAAEASFDRALALMSESERRQVASVEVLIDYNEQRLYRRLSPAERKVYEAALWRFADPLYLTPGNEAWSEHVSRYAWARLLEHAPVSTGMVSWGDDLEELTIRYGVPAARERSWGTWGTDPSLVERFDTAQLTYVLRSLRRTGLPSAPAPGTEWELRDPRARSGHAPPTFRRLVPLLHQVTRFPKGDSTVVRVDARLELDSALTEDSRIEMALFVLDRKLEELRRATQLREGAQAAAMPLAFEASVPARPLVYSLEAYEAGGRFGARARYALEEVRFSADSLALSDVLIAHAYGGQALPRDRADPLLRARADLRVAPTDTLGVYAEAHGLEAGTDGAAHYRVQLVVQRPGGPSLATRLGRRLGLVGQAREPRMTWDAEADPGVAVIAVDVVLSGIRTGDWEVELTVTDRVTGTRRSSTRLVYVRAAKELNR